MITAPYQHTNANKKWLQLLMDNICLCEHVNGTGNVV